MINTFVKSVLGLLMLLWSHLYTYRLSQWLVGKRNMFYTLWIRNFLGEVGEKCFFQYPLRLQGGGSKRIRIGVRTCIQAYSILGSWERYGKDERYEPEIIIGNDCNIGEFCHITAINKITIGDGLLTGRFVYIGDNVIIGAGSIVTHDIPSNSMAAGAPAKVVRQL